MRISFCSGSEQLEAAFEFFERFDRILGCALALHKLFWPLPYHHLRLIQALRENFELVPNRVEVLQHLDTLQHQLRVEKHA